MSTNDDSLAGRINKRMKYLEIGVPDLVARTRLKYTTIMGIVKGEQRTVTQEKLYRIAKALETTMEWLTVGGAIDQKSVTTLDQLLDPLELRIIAAFREANKTSKLRIEAYVAGLAPAAPAASSESKSRRPFANRITDTEHSKLKTR
jgi:transcriptional regulator with XRE-family HTH domain